MFIVAILQQATVKPPNIIAHEKGFKFHAQHETVLTNADEFDLVWVFSSNPPQLLHNIAVSIEHFVIKHIWERVRVAILSSQF